MLSYYRPRTQSARFDNLCARFYNVMHVSGFVLPVSGIPRLRLMLYKKAQVEEMIQQAEEEDPRWKTVIECHSYSNLFCGGKKKEGEKILKNCTGEYPPIFSLFVLHVLSYYVHVSGCRCTFRMFVCTFHYRPCQTI